MAEGGAGGAGLAALDAAPRSLPARIRITGQHVVLEPLHRRHAPELWRAAQAAEADQWRFLAYGPFASEAELTRHVAACAAQHDPMFWAARPVLGGQVGGWLSLMDIQPHNAALELGHIWFSPALRRSAAATEAMFLLLRLAAEDLGYRRLVWKCDALNMPSRHAAERLGFVYEGTLRQHMIVKGRSRDTAMYALLDHEWPDRAAILRAWLAPENFTAGGTALARLASFRAAHPA